jgi:hypothetical protein
MDGMMGGGGLTPEQLQALMEYGAGQGAFTEQDREIQRQIARANALRDRGVTPHTTGAGAMFGGMGDVLNQFTGARDAKAAQARDTALQQERIKALRELAARFGPQQQAQPDPSIPPMLARPPGM